MHLENTTLDIQSDSSTNMLAYMIQGAITMDA